jgi:hypothetical protein
MARNWSASSAARTRRAGRGDRQLARHGRHDRVPGKPAANPLPMRVVVVENGSGDGSADAHRGLGGGHAAATAADPGDGGAVHPAAHASPWWWWLPTHRPTAEIGSGGPDLLTLIESPDNLRLCRRQQSGDAAPAGRSGDRRHVWLLNNDTVVAAMRRRRCWRGCWRATAARACAARWCAITGRRIGAGAEWLQLQPAHRPVRRRWAARPGQPEVRPANHRGCHRFRAGRQPGRQPRVPRWKSGPMAEDYFLYYEEIDWATRNRRLGDRRFAIGFAHGATGVPQGRAGHRFPDSARSARGAFPITG